MKKYRLTALVLAGALLLPSLAACGMKKGEIAIDEVSTEEGISAKKSDVTTAKTTETTTAETTTAPATTAPATTVPTTAAPTTEAATTAAPATEPPTTAAPTTEAPTEPPTEAKKKLSAAEIAGAIAAKQGLFDEALVESSSSRGLSLFGIDTGSVAEASYYAASAAVADEILVIKLSSSTSPEDIRSDFAARQNIQEEDYEDYVPSEVPKIKNAVIYQNDDIMVFCVSNDSDAVRGMLDSLF